MENRTNKQIVTFIIIVCVIAIFIFVGYTFSYENTNNNNNNSTNNNFSDKVTYTATFNINGASYLAKNKISCEVQNGLCLITLPIALRDDGDVLGYNTSSTETTAIYRINQQVNLTSDAVFYVISKKNLHLNIINDDIDYLSNNNSYCTIYNEEDFCKVSLPFYNKTGYEVRGYSTNKNSLTGIVYPGYEYKIKRDTTLYPIYNNLTRGQVINVNKTTTIGNTIFDIENGCPYNVYNDYLEYFKKINNKAPYLMIGSKVSFLTDNTFDKIWGDKYVGMNYGPKDLRLFDVRCSNDIFNNYYATIVHELAHTWDFYYGSLIDKDISEQSDVINLFNQYKNINNRPFRDYSYTDIREFFADMVRYYYLKYIDPTIGYRNLSYPSDIKNVLEKYICIANNGYDDTKCK